MTHLVSILRPLRYAAHSDLPPVPRIEDPAREREFWTRTRPALPPGEALMTVVPPNTRIWLAQQIRRERFIETEHLSPDEAAFLPPEFDPANPESPRWTDC